MIDDKKARGMMAAHLCDIAGIALRGGEIDKGRTLAYRAAQASLDGDANDYRWSLKIFGLTPEQIDAAVAAIERGEWPADSTAGRLKALRKEAFDRADVARLETDDRATEDYEHGKADAYSTALGILGVKP